MRPIRSTCNRCGRTFIGFSTQCPRCEGAVRRADVVGRPGPRQGETRENPTVKGRGGSIERRALMEVVRASQEAADGLEDLEGGNGPPRLRGHPRASWRLS
jgi:hypothetical protein